MLENIINFFKNLGKTDKKENSSRDTAKERLHLVLMQDRANVSADFLDLMRQEIIEVIKKYVDIDESEIDVRMTNKQNEDGSNGAPALYANIPIVNIKNDILVEKKKEAEEAKMQNVKIEIQEKANEPSEIAIENNEPESGESKEDYQAEHQEEIINEESTEETNEPVLEEYTPETINN